MKKRLKTISYVVYLLVSGIYFLPQCCADLTEHSRTTGVPQDKAVFVAAEIEEEGRQLTKAGDYEGALAKYNEVLKSKYWTYDWETGPARGGIIAILKLQCKFEEALSSLQWHLALNPSKYEQHRRELTALIEYWKTGNVALVHDYILYRKTLYPKWMPPNSATDLMGISDVLRLYNTIGAHDAGIKFIDQIRIFLNENQVEFGEKAKFYDTIVTSKQATMCAELDKPVKSRNPDWRTCNLILNYLLVREAFEQDKSDGFKGCAHSPPGQVCMGKATKALIQSDYFPW